MLLDTSLWFCKKKYFALHKTKILHNFAHFPYFCIIEHTCAYFCSLFHIFPEFSVFGLPCIVFECLILLDTFAYVYIINLFIVYHTSPCFRIIVHDFFHALYISLMFYKNVNTFNTLHVIWQVSYVMVCCTQTFTFTWESIITDKYKLY